jgi:hypothetical protein
VSYLHHIVTRKADIREALLITHDRRRRHSYTKNGETNHALPRMTSLSVNNLEALERAPAVGSSTSLERYLSTSFAEDGISLASLEALERHKCETCGQHFVDDRLLNTHSSVSLTFRHGVKSGNFHKKSMELSY